MTSTSIVLGLALLCGAVILVLSVGMGVFGYRPERAQRIRAGEASDAVIVEEVRRIHIAPPERFRRVRVDRHWFYLAVQFAAIGYSVSIMTGVSLTSNVLSLGEGPRFAMAASFLVGGCLCIIGSGMGLKIGRCHLVSGVSENLATSRLGDDIRLPYTFGVIGVFSLGVSTWIYSATSFGSTAGSLGGWLSGSIAAACGLMIRTYLKRIKQYSLTRRIVIDSAIERVIERGGSP